MSLLPAAPQKPPLHLHNQLGQVLRVGLDDLVKLGKLSGPEKDFGQAELEVFVVQAEGLEQGLAKKPGVQPGQLRRQELLVHGVQLGEGGPGWEPLLHQFEDAGHAGALQLRQDRAAFELVRHHLDVGLDAADEVGAGGPELLHQLLQLPLELAADRDEGQLALLRLRLVAVDEQGADELVGALLEEEGKLVNW